MYACACALLLTSSSPPVSAAFHVFRVKRLRAGTRVLREGIEGAKWAEEKGVKIMKSTWREERGDGSILNILPAQLARYMEDEFKEIWDVRVRVDIWYSDLIQSNTPFPSS